MTQLRDHGLVPLAEMQGELAHAAKGIPLRDRQGNIRAFAMVDAEDFEGLSAHRWHLTAFGYVARWAPGGRKNRRLIWLHREVLHLASGDRRQCDHINRNKLDNRRVNLRIVTDGENKQNVESRQGATSKHRGVWWDSGRAKWAVQVCIAGRKYSLGRFDTEEEAARVAEDFRARKMPYANN